MYCFGQRVLPLRVPLCSTRFQPQDCRNLLKLLILDETGLPLLFHQPAKVCILESHLRRRRCVEWAWFSTHPAVRSSTELSASLDFLVQSELMRGKNLSQQKKIYSSLLVATWTQLFLLLLFDLESSSQLWSSLSSWISWCSKWSWNGWYQTNEEDCSIHHVWNSHCTTCLRVGACVNVSNLNLRIKINPVKQPIQSNSVGSRHTSHCGTSTFDNHFDYRLIGTSRKRAYFIDTLKGSPEIDSHLRMFSCHSSSAISQAVSSEGKVFALMIVLMRLCTLGPVFGAYLVVNARHANAPFMSVIPLITANAGPLTFIAKKGKSFLAAVVPSSARVALVPVILMSWLVAGFSAPVNSAGTCADRRDACHQAHTAPLPCQHRSDVGGSWTLVKMWLQV